MRSIRIAFYIGSHMTTQPTHADANSDSIFSLIPESLRKSLEARGISKPTSIQQAAYAPILAGQDIIAQSRTGSGKTLAFGLPSFARLGKSKPGRPRLLVLTPTRELAQQVSDVFEENFKPQGFRTLAITGGKSYRFQIGNLDRGVDAIVATPGRLNDLLSQKSLNLSEVEVLVLDEMDEMLDFGFAEDILKIKDAIGKKAQTLLFSATFPPKVATIARQMVHKPFEIKIASTDTSTGQIDHGFIEVKSGKNLDALLGLLLYYNPEHALIFCKTREETKNIHSSLLERGFSAGVLNGEMSQHDRTVTMERFKNNKLKLLVATDVAARGIDVSGLSHVINFTVPTNIEAYTHRAGRTGRAGATGKAWTIVAYNDRREYQFICSRVKITPTPIEMPTPKKIALQFLNNYAFQVRASSMEIPPFAKAGIDQFLETLDADQLKEMFSNILKSEMTRQIGKSLHVEDISPAAKTEFSANSNVSSSQRFGGDRDFSSRGGSRSGGGDRRYGGNGGGRGGNYGGGRGGDRDQRSGGGGNGGRTSFRDRKPQGSNGHFSYRGGASQSSGR
jgi:ATP-dependent RNA helicase DeaD